MTEAAFHTVWMPLQEHFWRIAYYILENRDDASDAVQDLYLKLWNLRDSLDMIQSPKAYGGMLLKNLCIDRELSAREDVAFIGKAIRELPPGQQRLLTLRVVQGLSYEEISKKTGLSGLDGEMPREQLEELIMKAVEE